MRNGERSVLSYFQDRLAAEDAERRLREAGVEILSLDELTESGDAGTLDATNPLTGNFSGLSRLTLGERSADDDERVAKAAHPDASGMADPGGQPRAQWILTAVVPEEAVDRTVEIIKACGGYV